MNRTITFVCLKEVNAPFNELRNTEVKTFGRHYISSPQMHQYIYISGTGFEIFNCEISFMFLYKVFIYRHYVCIQIDI